ncbi:MAG: aromatic amino acid transport family protein [Helicobacter sp.]|nr:aromatic amino acid transport family protein [Helicobacter sp.]
MSRFNLLWIVSLFGTAVGAGILFLPINAGLAGFWPLVVMAVIIGPMTYFAHRGFGFFILSSKQKFSDITHVVDEHFGSGAGRVITILYFFSIFPILLIYGNGITNTADSFIINQLGFEQPNRVILSLILVLLLVGIMLLNESFMFKIMSFLTYPLAVILFGMSLFLIPHWNLSIISEFPSAGDFFVTLWISIPVLVFSFNHLPAISSLVLSLRAKYGDFQKAEANLEKITKQTSTILVFFIMFFVFSCVLSLSPSDLALAKSQNISILSYLANKFSNPWISYLGPLIAFLAIASSFIGHYLGAREGLVGIFRTKRSPLSKKAKANSAIFFIIVIWLVAIKNPSILGIIESFGGPIIAGILFLMPMFAIVKVPAMARYKNRIYSNTFVTFFGFVTISAIIYGLFS